MMGPFKMRAPMRAPGDEGGGAASSPAGPFAVSPADSVQFVQAAGPQVVLPQGINPAEADFERAGPDLLLHSPDGKDVLVADFFMSDPPPTLIGSMGLQLGGDLAARLAGALETSAPGSESAGQDVVARVTGVDGTVTVIRADGSRVILTGGDPLFRGDILQTGEDGGVGVLWPDNSQITMGQNGRMVLDDVVFDANGQHLSGAEQGADAEQGNVALSVMRGVFTLVSGTSGVSGGAQQAASAAHTMVIHTPLADIAMEDAQIGVDLSATGRLSLVMMENAGGGVGEVIVRNDGGTMTLNEVYATIVVSAYDSPPQAASSIARDDVVAAFVETLSLLAPDVSPDISLANDYGQRSDEGQAYNDFATAAGESGEGDSGLAGFDVPPLDAETNLDGLADFEGGEETPPLDTAAANDAVVDLTADVLSAQTDAVFGATTASGATTAGGAIPVETDEPLGAPNSGASDSGTSDQGGQTAPVEPENRLPVAEAGSVIVAEDNAFNGQLVASDLDGDNLQFALAEDAGPLHGTVVIDADGSFRYEPAGDFFGTDSFTYRVSDDAGGSALATVTITVGAVGDAAQVAVADASGLEDNAIALTIAASMAASTGETVSKIELSGIPNGAVLSAGTDNGDGTWTLSVDDLPGLTLTPGTDFSGRFDVGLNVVSSDGGVASDSFTVTVAPVADVPVIAVADVQGVEDSAVALTLAASMAADTGETLSSLTITGVPDGAVLSAGVDHGDGTWSVDADQLAFLTLTPPTDFNGTLTLGVVATASDGATASRDFDVVVQPLADVPQLALADAVGSEDGAITLTLAATMAADSTEAVYTVTVSGLPEGARLSAGMDNGDGSWTLTPDLLDGLKLLPPADFNGTFDLTVTAVSTDGGAVSRDLGVTVMAVADTPVIATADVGGTEDSAIALTIGANMAPGTGETIDAITLSGVPDGAVLSAGTDNGDGTWTLNVDDLPGLTLTPASNASGVIELTVAAQSSDGAVATSTFNVAVAPVADTPVLQVSDVVVSVEPPPGVQLSGTSKGDELSGGMGDDVISGGGGDDVLYGDSAVASQSLGKDDKHDFKDDGDDGDDAGSDGSEALVVPLDVNAALTDMDGSEALSLEISNVPDGASLSLGSDNGDGTWSLVADDLAHLNDLTLTLPAGAQTTNFTLGVNATASEFNADAGAATATTTADIDVTFDVGPGGADVIDGGGGNDTVYGGGGADQIDGGRGADTLYGEEGADRIDGGQGRDTIYGGEGADQIDGGRGNDTVYGGDDADQIDGGQGADILHGDNGADTLEGGRGNDQLYGDAGDDTLSGGRGADTLVGGAGDDVLQGGSGADAFVFHAGDGDDIVLDLGHQDVLRFEGQEFNMDDFSLQADSGEAPPTITFGADTGVSVTLNDVDIQDTSSYTVTQDGDAVVVTFDKDAFDT